MTDRWFYTSEGVICGPASSEELQRLIQAGSVGSTDTVWADGRDRATGVPAKAALELLKPPVADATAATAAPSSAPEWLPALAAAMARGDSPGLAHSPSPAAWIADVRPAEETPKPRG